MKKSKTKPIKGRLEVKDLKDEEIFIIYILELVTKI